MRENGARIKIDVSEITEKEMLSIQILGTEESSSLHLSAMKTVDAAIQRHFPTSDRGQRPGIATDIAQQLKVLNPANVGIRMAAYYKRLANPTGTDGDDGPGGGPSSREHKNASHQRRNRAPER